MPVYCQGSAAILKEARAMLRLQSDKHTVTVVDEYGALYPKESAAEPSYLYDSRQLVGDGKADRPNVAHGLRYGDAQVIHSSLIMAEGSPSGVDSHSALLHDDLCILAISHYLAALHLPSLALAWTCKVDNSCSCFGVYDVPKYASYISHGECEIARVTYSGELLWQAGGKDIFTNGFALYDDHLIAVDFNDEKYRIDLSSGQSVLLNT